MKTGVLLPPNQNYGKLWLSSYAEYKYVTSVIEAPLNDLESGLERAWYVRAEDC